MLSTSSRPAFRVRHVRRALTHALLLLAGLTLTAVEARAQPDTSFRMKQYIHDVGYGATLGFLYAGVAQLRDDPAEWGKGWPGFGNRLASNVGEFVVQETATDILSWAMDRPLGYTHCPCTGTTNKVVWALKSSVTDVLPRDHRVIAVPRLVGAYAGSFAQAAWLPNSANQTQTALVNGTVSLLIGAGINLFHELRSGYPPPGSPPNVAGVDRR